VPSSSRSSAHVAGTGASSTSFPTGVPSAGISPNSLSRRRISSSSMIPGAGTPQSGRNARCRRGSSGLSSFSWSGVLPFSPGSTRSSDAPQKAIPLPMKAHHALSSFAPTATIRERLPSPGETRPSTTLSQRSEESSSEGISPRPPTG